MSTNTLNAKQIREFIKAKQFTEREATIYLYDVFTERKQFGGNIGKKDRLFFQELTGIDIRKPPRDLHAFSRLCDSCSQQQLSNLLGIERSGARREIILDAYDEKSEAENEEALVTQSGSELARSMIEHADIKDIEEFLENFKELVGELENYLASKK